MLLNCLSINYPHHSPLVIRYQLCLPQQAVICSKRPPFDQSSVVARGLPGRLAETHSRQFSELIGLRKGLKISISNKFYNHVDIWSEDHNLRTTGLGKSWKKLKYNDIISQKCWETLTAYLKIDVNHTRPTNCVYNNVHAFNLNS